MGRGVVRESLEGLFFRIEVGVEVFFVGFRGSGVFIVFFDKFV